MNERQTAELGRDLKRKIARRLKDPICEGCWELVQGFNAVLGDIDQARQWLREGAPGRALEILDAARERMK